MKRLFKRLLPYLLTAFVLACAAAESNPPFNWLFIIVLVILFVAMTWRILK
jgi:hypothetical protein